MATEFEPAELTYSVKNAAELVGRSTKTIVRWCRDGSLPNAAKVPGLKGLLQVDGF